MTYLFFSINTHELPTMDYECGIRNALCNRNNTYIRSIDASCNNCQNPNWGTQNSVYDRLVPAKYGKRNSITHAKSGKSLPNARKVSTMIFSEQTSPDPELTASAIEYGQFIAHDLSEISQSRSPLACCTSMLKDLDNPPEDCVSIAIPRNDYYYSSVNATCISVLRTLTNQELGCSLYSTRPEQISKVTAFLDLSVVYGNTEEMSQSLRSHKGGALFLNVRNKYQWLPPALDRETFCPMIPDNQRCYLAGDDRADQNPQLTMLQIIWAREHNRIAKELSEINPHWNDEKIFQVTRNIAIAEHQYLTYYKLLPYWTSRNSLIKFGVIYGSDYFIDDYDKQIRPHVFNEFSHAAFRYFHSLIPGILQLVDSSGCPYRSKVLRDHILNPDLLEQYDNFDSLLRGFTTQPSLTPDAFTDPEITNFFVANPLKLGLDLKAIDVQRSREHGLGSYNDLREFCMLERVEYFHQLLDVMDETSIEKLEHLYEHVDDIDLVVGGSLEIPISGTVLGPTFSCIVYEQFYRTRKADRFFFESSSSGFTLDQLNEIRKFSFSRLLCDNGNDITNMQKDGFLQVSCSNPRVPCEEIPEVDLSLWMERSKHQKIH